METTGYAVLTSNNEAVASGVPVIVYGIQNYQVGGTGFVLRNASSTGDIVFNHNTLTDGSTISIPFGIIFPNGCYRTNDSSTIRVFYRTIQ